MKETPKAPLCRMLQGVCMKGFCRPIHTDILCENSPSGRPPRATSRFNAYQAFLLYTNSWILSIWNKFLICRNFLKFQAYFYTILPHQLIPHSISLKMRCHTCVGLSSVNEGNNDLKCIQGDWAFNTISGNQC